VLFLKPARLAGPGNGLVCDCFVSGHDFSHAGKSLKIEKGFSPWLSKECKRFFPLPFQIVPMSSPLSVSVSPAAKRMTTHAERSTFPF
jgi:hypothetical protein